MPKTKELQAKKLEEHEPGATRKDVFVALKKVVTTPKTSAKSE